MGQILDRHSRFRSPLIGPGDLGIYRPTREALENVLSGFLLPQTTILPLEFCRGVVVGLTVIESSIVRGIALDRPFVLVGPNNSIQVLIVVICRQPFGVISPPSLSLEVIQRNIPSLRISGVTSWVCGVHSMPSEPVLRGVSEQPLAEPDETLLPVTRIVQPLCSGELLRLVGSLLSGSSPPAYQDDQEDESASEGHEKNLPPLESVGVALRGGRGVDSGDGRQRWDTRRSGGLWNHDQLGKADAHQGDNRRAALATRVNTRASPQHLAIRVPTGKAGAGSRTGATRTIGIAGLAGGSRLVEELILRTCGETTSVCENRSIGWTARALVERSARTRGAVGVTGETDAGGTEGAGGTGCNT